MRLATISERTTARLTGALFILATGAFSLSVAVLEPVLGAGDVLAAVAANPGRVGLGVFLELVNHGAVVAIAVVLFPVLRAYGHRIALGYVATRTLEAALFGTATLHLVALTALSRSLGGGGADAEAVGVLVDVLMAGHDWNRAVVAFTAFGVGALVLNHALFWARMVPRWIAVFGLVSALSLLAARWLPLAGVDLSSTTVTVMDGPIFAQEMVLAVWLIARGFAERPVEAKSP